MEFLSKHYEKLLLAFCLLCLIAGVVLVAQSSKKNEQTLSEQLGKVRSEVKGGELLEQYSLGDYTLGKFTNDPRKQLNVVGSLKKPTPKGSLLDPGKYILCSNEDCNFIISLSDSVCPFCGTDQPELAKESAEGDDSDLDGLPDKFELAYRFLDPYDPRDGRYDSDFDGFLNVEEYELKTKIDDPDDFPNLAHLLRVESVYHEKLPMKFIEIEQNRSDDKKKWEAIFEVNDVKKKKTVRYARGIGDAVERHEVKDMGFNGQTPYVIVSSPNNDTDQYRMEPDKDTEYNDLSLKLIYLASRDKNSGAMVMNRFRMIKKVGDEFKLDKIARTKKVTEYYRILSCDEANNTITVGLLKEKEGDVEKEITVKTFKFIEDFVMSNGGPGGIGGAFGGLDMGVPGGIDMGPGGRGGRGSRRGR